MRILVALLLVLPLVAAGTGEAPEVTDPEGDSISGQGDVVAAWIEPTSPGAMDIHVRFASLSEQDVLRVQASWSIRGPFAGTADGPYVATGWTGPTGLGGDEIDVEASYGTPGHLVLLDVPSGGSSWGGGTVHDLRIDVRAGPGELVTGTSLNGVTVDGAGPGSAFIQPLGGNLSQTPWPFNGTPTMEGAQEPAMPGPADVTAFWLHRNGTGFDFTVQLRSMTFEEMAACEDVRVFVRMGSYRRGVDIHGSSSLSFHDGWVRFQYNSLTGDINEDYDTVGTLDFPYQVRWVPGTPGYFQIHAQDIEGLNLADPSVSAHCGRLDDTLRQEITFGEIFAEGAPFLLPAFFAVVATAVGTTIVKKRKGRQ